MKFSNIYRALSIKIILITTISINLLTGCGEGFKDEDEIIQNEKEISELTVDNEPQETYELDEYIFDGKKTLTGDLVIDAEEVIFLSGASVILNQFNVFIKTASLKFIAGNKVIGFEEFNYNGCYAHGKSSGSFNVDTKVIVGSPQIDLAGQDAGMAGMYLNSSSKRKIRSSHVGIGTYAYTNECLILFRGYPKDMGKYRLAYNGGAAGSFKINFIPDESFNPSVSQRKSHGSYESVLDYSVKSLSGIFSKPAGQDGNAGQVCYLVGKEYLCQ